MTTPKLSLNFGRKNSSALIYILILSLVLLGIYASVYWYEPLPDYWNTLLLDALTILPATAAAVTGMLLLNQFEPGEKPRTIWLWFTLGWWCWVLGEISATVYDVFRIPYGDLSVFDIFWVLGYLAFGLSLFYQYRRIFDLEKKYRAAYYSILVVVILLISLGLTQLALRVGLGEDISWFALYLAVFYPVCDLVIGLAALWLAFLFGRGNWGRPWWGLIAFAVADAINIFLWIGGDKLLSESAQKISDWVSSVVYIAGYLVVMFGFLSILFLNFWTAHPKLKEPGGPDF